MNPGVLKKLKAVNHACYDEGEQQEECSQYLYPFLGSSGKTALKKVHADMGVGDQGIGEAEHKGQ